MLLDNVTIYGIQTVKIAQCFENGEGVIGNEKLLVKKLSINDKFTEN